MIVIAVLLALPLFALAALHLSWAMGRVWPASDPAELSRYIVGDPRRPNMPPRGAMLLTAVALAVAACDAGLLGFPLGGAPGRLAAWLGAGFVAVFACRGVLGYLGFWRATHPGTEFALLDKRFYSPACILLAEGFFLLVSERL